MLEWLSKFIVGSPKDSLAIVDFKIARLRGQLALLAIILGIFYFLVDKINSIKGNDLYYITMVCISTITFWLNRKGKYLAANIIFISLVNLVVFYFASKDIYRLGTHMFFLCCCIMAIVLFGYRDRKAALFASGISLLLFVLSYIYDVLHLDKPPLSNEFIRINFTINFIVALVICLAIVYFLMDVNFHSEKEILKKNELLVKTNAELDSFVYRASHDLRSPLSSILGLAEIGTLTDDLGEAKKCLAMIKERVAVQDQFIKEIIDYSRNARQEILYEKVVLKTLLINVIDGLRYNEGAKRIDFQLNIDHTFEIVTDKIRLTVILNNLIGNAIKYHDPNKGSQYIKIEMNTDDNNINLAIEDNGIGIEDEHFTKIFTMFYRATERSKGSGLGLYIVNETVQKLGGLISFNSTFGIGTRFLLVIPINN
ncbi:MAG TPA: HAMP domain-containing sensor histidine kinase [Cyclobacteriaceae bacterium]|nr:HAMP domain-containing sensor histidine kinase [Cyclobacteriaceae bacterium]